MGGPAPLPSLRVTALLLVLAGVGAGLTGSIAGLASLVSYPALLAAGLGPVAANVTNTVALVGNSTGSVLGSRPELGGQRAHLRVLVPAGALGGVSGGLLLLVTPATAFERLVPWLIGAGSLAVLVRRRPERRPAPPRGERPGPAVVVAVFAIGVYGGYFGAAAGVLLLALLLLATTQDLLRANATKNVTLGLANALAAVCFALAGPVHWADAAWLGLGGFAGGRAGPVLVRRVPAGPLRVAIALAGLGLAVHLGLDAYR